MLEVGSEAPGFTVADQEGQSFTLADQRGRWTLLWWYPKASTPG
jgi:peroxiredoxin Q/BCP